MAVPSCRHFNGYKPCGLSARCEESCPRREDAGARILVIHLGALGAVVRGTAMLAPLRRKFSRAHVTWVTDRPADQLLRAHPGIDRVLVTSEADLLSLSVLEFDAAFVVDKSLKAAGVLKRTRADLVFGFVADARTGAILPATSAADELWQIGLDDHRKFFVNRKPETHLVTEALELGPWRRDRYWLPLAAEEQALRDERRARWSVAGTRRIVGLNTGCAATIPMKKLSVGAHREIARRLLERGDVSVVLLGGPEDAERNREIARGLDVIESPVDRGLRDGLASVAACDVVVTGDSLGMHLAISQSVWTVAWFGPTCAHEIDLYDRGEALVSPVACSPCWKRACSQTVLCYDRLRIEEVEAAVLRGLHQCRMEREQQPEVRSNPRAS